MNKSITTSGGVAYDEYFAKKRNAVQAKGISAEQQRGVPMNSYVTTDECHGVTKAGNACRARPVTGGLLCVGHVKQAEANT